MVSDRRGSKVSGWNILAIALVLLVAACGGKQEREARYLVRGKAMFEQSDYGDAESEFRKAIQINPEGIDGRYYLGLIEARRGNREQAIALLDRVTAAAPQRAEAHLELAHLYVLMDDLDKAATHAAALERLKPASAELYALEANIALRRHRFEDASDLAERALEKDPLDVAASTVLTSTLARKGETSAARTVLADALERRPEDLSLLLFQRRLQVRLRQQRVVSHGQSEGRHGGAGEGESRRTQENGPRRGRQNLRRSRGQRLQRNRPAGAVFRLA